jgi:hypothetical protein
MINLDWIFCQDRSKVRSGDKHSVGVVCCFAIIIIVDSAYFPGSPMAYSTISRFRLTAFKDGFSIQNDASSHTPF